MRVTTLAFITLASADARSFGAPTCLPAASRSAKLQGQADRSAIAATNIIWSTTPCSSLQSLVRLRGGVRELEDAHDWVAVQDEAGDKLLVVDFTAVWCGPCQRIAPAFAALAEEYADSAVFVKVDVDKMGDIAAEMGVTSMPTFLFLRDGEVVDRMSGADEAGLRSLISELTAATGAAA